MAPKFNPKKSSNEKSCRIQPILLFCLTPLFAAAQTHLDFSGTHVTFTKTDQFVNIQVYEDEDGTISFPQDGRQPTTEEAVRWSLANNNDPRISKWYKNVFGFNDSYCLGHHLDEFYTPTSTKLIKIKESDRDKAVDYDRGQEKFVDVFWQNFEAVASNPAGRLLLYRILIEVLRVAEDDFCCELRPGRPEIEGNLDREKLRSMEIANAEKENEYWSYDSSGRLPVITCCYNKEKLRQLTLATKEKNGIQTIRPENASELVEAKTLLVKVALFHELLHWYQQLRYSDRVKAEKKCLYPDALKKPFVQKYYDNCYRPIPLLSWGMGSLIDVEDLRVICGAQSSWDGYLEGDDLSENVFRIFESARLRFGHSEPLRAPLLDQAAVMVARNTALTCAKKIAPNIQDSTQLQ